MSDRIAEIRERAKQYAKRYPWRLEEGTKDFLPRDRAYLLARLSAITDALDREKLADVLGIAYADAAEDDSVVVLEEFIAEVIRRHVLGEEQG